MVEQSSIFIFTSVVLFILIVYFVFALYSLRERKVEFGPDTRIEIMDIPLGTRGSSFRKQAFLNRPGVIPGGVSNF